MIARATGERVRIEFSYEDPTAYFGPLNELLDAEADLRAHESDLSTYQLRPFRDRISAAEIDLEDLFSETISIDSAEFVLRTLQKAIAEAKVARGDFA